jgi:hypothetical protein
MTKLDEQREVINLEILKAGFVQNPRTRGTFIYEKFNGDKLKIDTRKVNFKLISVFRPAGSREILTTTLVSKPISKINPASVVPTLRKLM